MITANFSPLVFVQIQFVKMVSNQAVKTDFIFPKLNDPLHDFIRRLALAFIPILHIRTPLVNGFIVKSNYNSSSVEAPTVFRFLMVDLGKLEGNSNFATMLENQEQTKELHLVTRQKGL